MTPEQGRATPRRIFTPEETELLQRIRARAAEEFGKTSEYPFFWTDLRDHETIDEMLMRLFEAERATSGAGDKDVIDALVMG